MRRPQRPPLERRLQGEIDWGEYIERRRRALADAIRPQQPKTEPKEKQA